MFYKLNCVAINALSKDPLYKLLENYRIWALDTLRSDSVCYLSYTSQLICCTYKIQIKKNNVLIQSFLKQMDHLKT